MTELTNALFEFMTTHYIPGIYNDPEYEEAKKYAKQKEEQLSSQLNEQQRQLLDDLLSDLKLAHFFELEHIFLAALALSKELAGLVRP